MGNYELNDVLVRRAIEGADPTADHRSVTDLLTVLESQVPIDAPPYIGAMVRTADGEKLYQAGVYIRWATDNHTHSPWIRQSDHEQPYRTDEIGRIVRVLCAGHEGVELG